MEKSNKTWNTFYGKSMNVSELSHQHMSNILWYSELVVKDVIDTTDIETELNTRYGGIRLPYHPMVSFVYEIDTLKRLGYTTGEMDAAIVVDGKWIGSIKYN